MKSYSDPLYSIFEHHLMNALVEEETAEELLTRVVKDYIERVTASGTVIPREHRESVEADLHDEVLEMLRKKTYGHFSLADYRKAKAAHSQSENAKARRRRAS